MIIEGALFAFIAVFLAVADVIYWITSHDPTGTTCIALGAVLGSLCGFYLTFTGRRFGARPEDRADAEIAEGAGVLGHFSPGSWWPVAVAFCANLFFLGIIFGLWLSFVAAAFLLVSLWGLLFEHFKGGERAADEQLLRHT